jgi:hypothetical protein
VSAAALDSTLCAGSALDPALSLLLETSPLIPTKLADGAAAAEPWSKAFPIPAADLLNDSLFPFKSRPLWSPERSLAPPGSGAMLFLLAVGRFDRGLTSEPTFPAPPVEGIAVSLFPGPCCFVEAVEEDGAEVEEGEKSATPPAATAATGFTATAPMDPAGTAAPAKDPGPLPAAGLDTAYLEAPGTGCLPRPMRPRPAPSRPLPARDPGPRLESSSSAVGDETARRILVRE